LVSIAVKGIGFRPSVVLTRLMSMHIFSADTATSWHVTTG